MLAAYGCVRKPDLDNFNWKAPPPLACRVKFLTENLVHLGLITAALDPTGTPVRVALRFPTRLQHLLPHRLAMYRLEPLELLQFFLPFDPA